MDDDVAAVLPQLLLRYCTFASYINCTIRLRNKLAENNSIDMCVYP